MITQLNFSKYKRLFTFGCSYTTYIWPTWADIIAKEMPDAEFYNAGRAGSGNLMISARVAEASRKYNIGKDDLVIILWSTYAREDRWVDGSWVTLGNIYNQNYYSKDWVKKCADPIGYLIRDMALIDLTRGYLQNNGCDFLDMFSCNIDCFRDVNYTESDKLRVQQLKTAYSDITTNMTYTMEDLNDSEVIGHSYYPAADPNRIFNDGHPTPLGYYKFLKTLNYPLTSLSENYATQSDKILRRCNTYYEIVDMFPKVIAASHKVNLVLV